MKRTMSSTAAVIGFLLLQGSVHAQGTYNKAAFEETMDRMSRGYRLVVSSLIAAEWAKAASSAATVEQTAKTIRKLTPKVNTERMNEFYAFADSVCARSARLAAATKAKDIAGATRALGETLNICMSCHATFRK